LIYGSDAATSDLRNDFWYLDTGDLQPYDPTKALSRNNVFIARWTLVKQSEEVQLLGRLHSDICHVIPCLIPDVKLQIKLTKGKRALYLMNTKADSTTKFQLLEAYLILNRIWQNPAYLIAHNATRLK
jgi:hypothetical protein